MKILLTGVAGFIGSHVCERLVSCGHEVVGVDNFEDHLYPSAIKRRTANELKQRLPPKAFQLVEADICNEKDIARVLNESVDVVCHLAALAGVQPSLVAPRRYVQVNIDGTTVLYEGCRAAGVDRVVLASSSSVYGAREGRASEPQAFRESEPCVAPASPYAATKRSCELLSSTYRDLYGLGITCLRFFTVYGPRQRPDMAIYKFTRAIADGSPITLYGDGGSRRDYTYIDDIVSGVVCSIESVEPGAYSIYNLGGAVTTSLAELVSMIEEVVGKSALVERLADQPGDVPITFADVTLARRELGYDPQTDLRSGIEKFWTWYQEQG